MAQDSAVAMRSGRREFVNCAFKAVERMILPAENNIKGFVIVVAAGFALSHGSFLPKLTDGYYQRLQLTGRIPPTRCDLAAAVRSRMNSQASHKSQPTCQEVSVVYC